MEKASDEGPRKHQTNLRELQNRPTERSSLRHLQQSETQAAARLVCFRSPAIMLVGLLVGKVNNI